jgi:hypothetical protein
MSTIKTRNDFLSIIPKNSKCCEIGVFRGDYSKLIYNICNPSLLCLVDIFHGKGYSGDKDGLNIVHSDDMNLFYNDLTEYYKNNSNVKIFKTDSANFLKNIPNNFFDFIYIDGDHSFDGVYSDLTLSYEKLKLGGILSGHDYHESIGGVLPAVDRFFYEKKLKLNTTEEDLLPTFWTVKE